MKKTQLLSLLLLVCLSLGQLTAQVEDRTFYAHLQIKSTDLEAYEPWREYTRFGAGVAAVGDIDGDGHTDLVVGAPGNDTEPGELWVLFMDSVGTVLRSRTLGGDDFPDKLTPDGSFGSRVEALGDWDGDGTPDVAVGEPRDKLGGLSYGTVWLIMLKPDGGIKDCISLHGRTPGLKGLVKEGFLFGTDITVIGDLDGNRQPDLAIGAPGNAKKNTGEVFIILMNNTESIKAAWAITVEDGGLKGQLRRGDQFGFAVEAAGDLNADGVPDLLVGAPQDDASGLNQGAMYTIYFKDEKKIKKWDKTVPGDGRFEPVIDFDDRWGSAIARMPAWDKGEMRSVVVGAHLDDDGGKDVGGLYVLGLDKKGKVQDHHKISQTTANFEGQLFQRGEWGLSLNPSVDFNGDSLPELLVSDHLFSYTEQGAFWMLSPRDWPARLNQGLTWVDGADRVSARDSARLYQGATTAEDSARIDSMFDLTGYAPSHIIFLLDVSASMSEPDKLPILQESFINLLPFLRREDLVSVITYSGEAKMQLDAVTAESRGEIRSTLQSLKSEGDTKPRRALEMAYAQARQHFIPDGNNRIIFATDGGFDPSELDKPIEKSASPEVPVSVFYFGKLSQRQIDLMEEIAGKTHGNAASITSASVDAALLREVKMIRKK